MKDNHETLERLAAMLVMDKPEAEKNNMALINAIAAVKEADENVQIWVKCGIINRCKKKVSIETIRTPNPTAEDYRQLQYPRVSDDSIYCPTCGRIFKTDRPNYCPNCGQGIDWSRIVSKSVLDDIKSGKGLPPMTDRGETT